MTPLGWIIMLASVGGVLASCVFCLYRLLTLPPRSFAEKLHDPRDADEAG